MKIADQKGQIESRRRLKRDIGQFLFNEKWCNGCMIMLYASFLCCVAAVYAKVPADTPIVAAGPLYEAMYDSI